MAHLIIGDGVNTGDLFFPDQLFAFGSFALRANSFGHLEKIESYALASRSDLET